MARKNPRPFSQFVMRKPKKIAATPSRIGIRSITTQKNQISPWFRSYTKPQAAHCRWRVIQRTIKRRPPAVGATPSHAAPDRGKKSRERRRPGRDAPRQRAIPPGSRCVEHRSLQSTQQCRRSSTQPPGRFSCFGTPSTRCTWWIVAATILPGRSGTVVVSHTGRHRHPPLPPDARRRAQPRPQPGPQNPRPRRPAARRCAVGHLRRQRKAHRPSTGPTPPSPRWTRTSGPNWPSTSAPCNCCRRFRESIFGSANTILVEIPPIRGHTLRVSVRRVLLHSNEAAGIPRGRRRSVTLRPTHTLTCFNEAAGIPRGRRRPRSTDPTPPPASMRPRVFPAEDPRDLSASVSKVYSFNEAAGIPRGRPVDRREILHRTACFNEAAGIPRGRPPPGRRRHRQSRRFNEAAGIPRGRRRVRAVSEGHVQHASMRPRVFPAEDATEGSGCRDGGSGFNEARSTAVSCSLYVACRAAGCAVPHPVLLSLSADPAS